MKGNVVFFRELKYRSAGMNTEGSNYAGGSGVERNYLVYCCLACGRGFDETGAGGGPDQTGSLDFHPATDVIKRQANGGIKNEKRRPAKWLDSS
jgi:hypothetical protein